MLVLEGGGVRLKRSDTPAVLHTKPPATSSGKVASMRSETALGVAAARSCRFLAGQIDQLVSLCGHWWSNRVRADKWLIR
jgi:hypothetical protein